MGFLDNTGLAKLWLKITSKLSGKVDTTTTVNGHPLSSNVTVTQQDIGINYSSTEPSNPSDGDIWLQPESEANIIHDTDIASSAITGKRTVNAALTQLNSEFEGATSSAGGSKGLVPAPLAGAQHKFLCADGDWADAPGSQTYVETVGPLTPTNGVLNQNFPVSYVLAEMKAIQVEPSDASVFMDTLTVTMSEGNINVSCPNMTGTCQSMAITFVLRSSAQGETITSSEFNILATRIGDLESLTTTAKTSTVAAINEVKSGVSALNDQIGDLSNKVSNNNDAYSASKAYAIGDLVIYNNVLYRCTTACSAASWDVNQSCFTADTLTNVVNIVNANVSPFIVRQNILRNVDLNDVKETGIYSLGGNITNGLSNANYGILVVFVSAFDAVRQIHFFADSNNCGTRRFHQNTWDSWQRFSLTT